MKQTFENADLNVFCDNFDIVQNALQMRTLRRWNGRDLRDEENLAEHTHLVVVCVFDLIDKLSKLGIDMRAYIDIEYVVKQALVHDSLEILRGDILSKTKDALKGLREMTDNEEKQFMQTVVKVKLNWHEEQLLLLADLMACYKFIEWELRYPSNEFAKIAYAQTKGKFDEYYGRFLSYLGIPVTTEEQPKERFVKGYIDDAGVDIILDRDVTFMPMSTTTIDLNVNITPEASSAAFLCARTSAAQKGIQVAACPIDPFYNGNVSAIVTNISNDIITYKKGEAFCQYVQFEIIANDNVLTKKAGRRTDSKFGGTDK